MLHIAICDDDELMVSKVEELASVFFRTHCVDIKIQSYQSGENLMYDLEDGFYFDLFLLDIEMPGIDGMGLAKSIHDNMPAARIIFITSHLEYAITAYEFSVFRYIPKMVLDEKLPSALEDFYKLYRLERNEFYTIQIKVEGTKGNWIAADEIIVDGRQFFLLQNDVYKDDVPYVVVSEDGKVVTDESKGFDETTIQKLRDFRHWYLSFCVSFRIIMAYNSRIRNGG